MPAPSRTQKGRFSKLFLDSASDDATPTWVEADLIRDGAYNITPQMENVTVRKHGRANRQESFGYDLEITFDIRVPVIATGVAWYLQLRDASMSGAPIHVRMSDGPVATAGTEILELWTEVSGFENSKPIDGHSVISVTLVQTSSDGEAEFSTGGGT